MDNYRLLFVVVAAFTSSGHPSFATDQPEKSAVNVQPASEKSPAGEARPRAAKPEAKSDDLERFRPFGYVRHEHEVVISGRAINENGDPVAGASVFVIPVIPMGVPYRSRGPLAEGKTDADGRYRFESVKLEVLEFAPQAAPKPSEALFQVFAVADGYGHVWRRTRAFRPEPRPAVAAAPTNPADDKKAAGNRDADNAPRNGAPQDVVFAGEPIVADLEFSPEVRLHGTVNDDLGNLLQNTLVSVLGFTYLEDSPRGSDGSFVGLSALPEGFQLARTDVDGRYEIRGLPRDCSLVTYIDYLPEFDPSTERIHTGKGPLAGVRVVGYSGGLNHTFIAPVTLRVKVFDHERRPLAGVIVRHESERGVSRAGALDRTNAAGIAMLKLRPGKCDVIVEPTIGQPWLPLKVAAEFPDNPREHSIELKLESAAEVVFEAVEKETGRPIAGIAFLSEAAEAGERRPVQSQLSFVDHPRTDVEGRLRAVFEPGEWRFFVDQARSPREVEPVAPTTDAVELTSGKPAHLRFEFTRRPATEAPEPIPDELKLLAELLQKQSERYERSRRARFRLRHNHNVRGPQTREQMTKFLDSLTSKTIGECLEAIRHEFPDFRGLADVDFVTDGTKRRVETRSSGYDEVNLNVFNGEELIYSMGVKQLDIHTRKTTNVHFLEQREFWDGPAQLRALTRPERPGADEEPRRTIRHAHGAWEIEVATSRYTSHLKIDDQTGFEYRMAFLNNKESGRETRQFFPTLLPRGLAVPKLSIQVDYRDARLVRCKITFIDQVELLERLPTEAFIVAAPAGTNILDYRGIPRDERGGGRRAPAGVVSAPIPDIVAHRNRLAPPGEPVLKVGDECPELDVLTWLDTAGETKRPVLAGKIIVVDFWGIGCGPCVAQLPEVNAAAKHFAESKIVVIGLHDSSGKLDDVAAFATKRGLVFPMAIDKPDPKSQSFGTTFAAFGVSGIPSCAVVDGAGRIAYLGQFEQAVEVASKLAQAK